MIIFRFRFKFILFCFIFICSLSCIKNKSETTSISPSSSSNYLLVYRGAEPNVALYATPKRDLFKLFYQDTNTGLFRMNYHITPSLDSDYNASNEEFQQQIKDISIRLNKNSTFIIMINAHGGKAGKCLTSKDPPYQYLLPQHIVDALRAGLAQNPLLKGAPFKRIILYLTACYSGNFIQKFKDIKEVKNQSLFKEAVYWVSSDAALPTSFEASNLEIFPFFLLRVFQIQRCNSKNDYKTDYEIAYNKLKQYLLSIREDFVDPLGADIFLPNTSNLITFHDTPIFEDVENIINYIKQKKNKNLNSNSGYTGFISFNDISVKNSKIFPNVCNKLTND